jgi:UDP-2,3-diacylglucosamine pyrophosphatase LpxH
MSTIRIAHISDLHFGSQGQIACWQQLRDYLNDTLKPTLVLVTGDIVHTPKGALFHAAKEELDLLRVARPNPRDAYRVCAGNHDRHPLGNASGKLAPFINLIRGPGGSSSWFDQVFRGVAPTIQNPERLELVSDNNRWTLRIMGCDTSEKAMYTAMGFVTDRDVTDLADSGRADPNVDLVILMHHHHLLSIWELEKNRQHLKDIFQPTVMLNAGTVLEALTLGHVNIVLHGHEHFRAYAKYGTPQRQDSETVVVGAGSGTGNDSYDGCALRRASFNVLELRHNRSIFLQEFRHDGAKWNPQPSFQLLDDRAIRRTRFYRRTPPGSPPTSKVTKYVDFKSDRTVEITQSWTNWTIENGQWTLLTQNSSGVLSPVKVNFIWQNDAPQSFCSDFVPSGRPHTYRADIDVGRRAEELLAKQITARFQWLGGAVLTDGDLALLNRDTIGEFRNRGMECAALQAHSELQSISLLVRLPTSYAPDKPEHINVYHASGDEYRMDSLETNQELTVQHHAHGVFSLEVPYPRNDSQYLLAWPVVKQQGLSDGARQFRRIAADPKKALRLLEAFSKGLDGIDGVKSIALYIEKDIYGILNKTAQRVETGREVPSEISIVNDNAVHRQAWWGTLPVFVVADESNDLLFGLGERALAFVPVRQLGFQDQTAWGIVRVGIYADQSTTNDDLFNALNSRRTVEFFADSLLMMLQEARELR